jgi:endoglycosylceramidase
MLERSHALCRFAAALASAIIILAAPALPASASPELRVEGRHFKDAQGRVVVLRGINVAGNSKVPPFTPASDPAIFDPLKAWGMNVVRLLFTWEAYEPSPGAYDAGYLDYYTAAARAAWERGLYVIVDFHQDGFSRYTLGGCGDGAPAWALPPSITPATPDNGAACETWGIQMLKDADMHAAWASFYADETGARTRYLAMLKSVAGHLDGEPGVIGYDMMNEPWGDELTEIGPFYEDAAVAIREASPTAILFVSPRALTSPGEPTELAPPSFKNAAYAPHFYDASVLLFKSWSGVSPDKPFQNMYGAAEAWGAPLFVGEFGAPAEAVDADLYMNVLYRKLDEGFASGAQWVYTPGWTKEAKDGWNTEDLSVVDDLGRTRPNFRARAYPRRIAGAPVRFTASGDPAAASVELEWEHDPAAGETELFVSPEALPGEGAAVIEVSRADASCAMNGPSVTCSSASAGPVRVRITKPPRAPEESDGGCGVAPRGRAPLGAAGLALLVASFAGAARRRKRDRAASVPSRWSIPGSTP